MVWADCDDDMSDGDALMKAFWEVARDQGIARGDFDTVVFVFAKDRLENWIQFLETGATDEGKEGPRVKHLNKRLWRRGHWLLDASRKHLALCRLRSSGHAGTGGSWLPA